MRAREVTAATVATLTLAVAVGCAASATVSSYLRGTWSCTSTGMEEPITVDVKDGTFALASGEERVTGTWDIAFEPPRVQWRLGSLVSSVVDAVI